jgi:hypothetical protein
MASGSSKTLPLLHRHAASAAAFPGRFKLHRHSKINGFSPSRHIFTLIGPFGTNIEFQMRTDAMHVVLSRPLRNTCQSHQP